MPGAHFTLVPDLYSFQKAGFVTKVLLALKVALYLHPHREVEQR